MPPKARITQEMILDAAFEIIRDSGVETVNARTVAQKLHCSTQPVMYHFKTIEELKRAVYTKADAFHSAYIMEMHGNHPLKDIGLNYIRFAVRERNLFRFLFQSNEFSGTNISELICAEELQPVLALLSQAAAISTEQAGIVFRSLFLIAHGYASMFANNEMEYDEQTVVSDLEFILDGAVKALKGDL